MKYLFFILLIFGNGSLWGQKMFENQSLVCPLKFIMEDQEQLIYYQPNDSVLVMDFLRDIEPKQQDKIKGVLMFQIMVDTVGQACCVSFANKTNLTDKKLDVPNRLNNLSGWRRVEGRFIDQNICTLYHFIFTEESISVTRTGYNRNTGKKPLSSLIFNRKTTSTYTDTILNTK